MLSRYMKYAKNKLQSLWPFHKKKTILNIPNDVMQLIFNQLNLHERSQLSQTCKQMHASFKQPAHWYSLFKDEKYNASYRWLKEDEMKGLLALIKAFRPAEKNPPYFLLTLLSKLNYEKLPWMNTNLVSSPYFSTAYRAGSDKSYARWFKKGDSFGHYNDMPIPKLDHLSAMWKVITTDYCFNTAGKFSSSIKRNYPTKCYGGLWRPLITEEGKIILALLEQYTSKCVMLYTLYMEIKHTYALGNWSEERKEWDVISDDLLYKIIQSSADLQSMQSQLENQLFADKKEPNMTRRLQYV